MWFIKGLALRMKKQKHFYVLSLGYHTSKLSLKLLHTLILDSCPDRGTSLPFCMYFTIFGFRVYRFCTECRTKVMKAYSLLVDEPEERKTSNSSESGSVSTSCDRSNTTPINGGESTTNGATIREKGFVPSLYAGIRRCSPNNHIHVDQRTDYIMGLILAAEPELLGKYVYHNNFGDASICNLMQYNTFICTQIGLAMFLQTIHSVMIWFTFLV